MRKKLKCALFISIVAIFASSLVYASINGKHILSTFYQLKARKHYSEYKYCSKNSKNDLGCEADKAASHSFINKSLFYNPKNFHAGELLLEYLEDDYYPRVLVKGEVFDYLIKVRNELSFYQRLYPDSLLFTYLIGDSYVSEHKLVDEAYKYYLYVYENDKQLADEINISYDLSMYYFLIHDEEEYLNMTIESLEIALSKPLKLFISCHMSTICIKENRVKLNRLTKEREQVTKELQELWNK